MNKKFSTLLAACLVAGYSATAEAGVVKITKTGIKTTESYVIAAGDLSAGAVNVLTNGGNGTLDQATSKTAEEVEAAEANYLFTFTANTTNWELTSGATAGQTAVEYDATLNTNNGGYKLAATATALTPGDGTGDAITLVSNSTKYLNLDKTSTATQDLHIFAISDAVIADDADGTYVTIDGKYLVVDKNGFAQLVNATEYAIAGYTAADAKWTIADGVLSFAANQAKQVTGISYDGAAYTVTTGSVGVEIETANGGDLYVGGALVANSGTAVAASVVNKTATAPASVVADGTLSRVSFAAGSPFMLHVNGQATSAYVSKAKNTAINAINTGAITTDFYWTANTVAGEAGVYTFTNQTGEQLNLNGSYEFKVVKAGTDLFYLVTTDGAKAVEFSGSTLALGAGTASAAVFSFHQIARSSYSAATLVKKLGDGFNLTIKNKQGDEGTTSLQGNMFQGKLTPVYAVKADGTAATIGTDVVTGFKAYTDADVVTTYMLANADGIIVLDLNEDNKWSVEGLTEFNGVNGGFKYKTLSKSDMISILNAKSTDANQTLYTLKGKIAYNFEITYPNNNQEGIDLIKVTGVAPASTATYRMIAYNNDKGYFLSAGLDGVGVPVYATFDGNAMVKATDDKNNPLLHKYVNITFKSFVSKVNGKVLAMDEAGDVAPVQASKFLFAKPEGQWAVTVQDDGADVKKFAFTNRESGETVKVDNMYYMGDDKYAVLYTSAAPFADPTYVRDTLVITKSAASELKNDLVQMDGYANFKATDVQDNQYRLAVASTDDTNFYVTENHSGKHLLGLTVDQTAATPWRLVPLTKATEYGSFGIVKTATDSLYTVNTVGYYNTKGEYKEYSDTLAIISYALQNTKNGEYLTYENPQTLDILSMICDPNSKAYTTSKELGAAYRFALKEKQNGLYNLVGVSYNATDKKYSLNLNSKLYGATTTKQGAVEVEGAYEQVNSNDLFDLQLVAAPDYRLKNVGDTIRIFREENNYDVMFENGEFLNLGNSAQLKDMAPALYVDTAYVNRGHNSRWQYLLAVNPKYVPEVPCNVEGHPTVHPDTTYGRFLVNLIDTAYMSYVKGAIHTNKYINDAEAAEPFAKLGFVYGFRTADKLYITDNKFTKSGNASDVIDLSTSDFNVAKFAFRYVNPISQNEEGAFKIQTGYYDYNSYIANDKRPDVSNEGYLKTINGVVVVVKGYDKGEEFNLAAEKSAPTSNDQIGTSEVSIIAANGSVIVKGAAGKSVAISNILGQTIVNTVLSSDNATISVPAGIVVVAVEGEEAVKTVVR